MRHSYRTSDVFVPGGLPQHTYVARSARHLESRLGAAKDNLCKLVTVTGATKSGKTVLASKVFPRDRNVWVDAGSIRDEDDLWTLIVDSLAGYTEVSAGSSSSTQGTVSAGGSGGAGIPMVGKLEAHGSAGVSHERSRASSKSRSVTPRPAAVSQLRAARTPLVIDDFHYLARELQGSIVRALKPLVFEGIPVVLIAIPHRRYDAIKVEREMTGRLEAIDIPPWGEDELAEIAQLGFPLLNVGVPSELVSQLASEAYGSPHLMQEFCREVARTRSVESTCSDRVDILAVEDRLFQAVAEGTGRVIYDKLARGPRQRSDRIERRLRSGESADIYEVVLLALARLAPGLATVEYERLRAGIRDVLADNIPQAHEVTRVLEKMAEIASSDEASTPVLDWEKEDQKLHITDPFFAFFLKWGVEAAEQGDAGDRPSVGR